MKILLVQPSFPKANKSKNHSSSLPIGLLKLATHFRNNGDDVKLVFGESSLNFDPDKIMITSLFTYWSKYVWESVKFYKFHYPRVSITVGGIYASLMPEHCKKSGCDEVYIGVHDEAEKCLPAYDLVPSEYQIIHTSRGCVRNCDFCGTWKIEPKYNFKETIKNDLLKNKILIYDNNFLANPNIENILEEISQAKVNGRCITAECQSGFDGRLLNKKIASLLKKARFRNPRIAWDGGIKQRKIIEAQIRILESAGYQSADIHIFVLYNWNIDFNEMELKRDACFKWGVQIADCRYRPLDQTFDNYNGHKKHQTSEDYYVHPNWTDEMIKKYRRNVREQNICIRHGFKKYDRELERLGKTKKAKQTVEKMLEESEITERRKMVLLFQNADQKGLI